MKNNINTMREFAKFLDDNDLVYAGETLNPFAIIGECDNPFECSGFMTTKEIENRYSVNLKILEEV